MLASLLCRCAAPAGLLVACDGQQVDGKPVILAARGIRRGTPTGKACCDKLTGNLCVWAPPGQESMLCR